MGNKILGAGEHTINIQGSVSRADGTTITGLTINDQELTDLTGYWPEGTTFAAGELFLFASTDKVTAITVGEDGSINAIRA